jgi:two-component system CheB/CheR fusion protein
MGTLPPSADADRSAVARLSRYLESRGDLDPNAYARASLVRRLRARREAVGVHDWDDYRARLDADPDEYAELLRSIPVHRTELFRDPQCWHKLHDVLAEAFRARPRPTFTIWSAGCATGEEAYSLAATALVACSGMRSPPAVRVIGTDVSSSVLATAGSGRIPSRRVHHLPAEAGAYFQEEGPHVGVGTGQTGPFVIATNELRRHVVFRVHDLLKERALDDIDLIACRNTLMYFSVGAQRRILADFASALDDDGLLFTGLAELPVVWTPHFEVECVTARIWRKSPLSD